MERRTFSKVLDTDVVELLDLLHDQLLLVDLHNDGRTAAVAPCEPEFAQRVLDLLGDVDGAGLHIIQHAMSFR